MRLILTDDGSHTLAIGDDRVEVYHSRRGAMAEARHVYIANGLHMALERSLAQPVKVLEIGLGTGLNALLALGWAKDHQVMVDYLGLEAAPPAPALVAALNYPERAGLARADFEAIHAASPDNWVPVTSTFSMQKKIGSLEALDLPEGWAQVVFYDAFSPAFQPEMWESPNLTKVYHAMAPGGFLVTYCAKSVIQRTLRGCGFVVERLPGPPGKREMVRATKALR